MGYTEQVVKLMVPLLKFYFHDDILQSRDSDAVFAAVVVLAWRCNCRL